MSGILQTLFLGAAAAVTDAYFNLVTLLLNTTATNGAQNNTFLDSSTNNFTITRNGNTTQGTFTPFSQTGWSNYFGSSNSLSVASNAAFAYGTGAITIEFWEWSTTAPTSAVEAWVTNGSNNINIQRSSGGFYNVYDGTDRVSSTTVVSNQWNHIAFVRQSGGQTNLYVNGTSVLSWTSSVNYGNDTFVIAGSGAFPFPGYISNLRVVKGTAVYTSSFTPSTTPLTAITNTSLLTCQSNRFVDNSASPLTLTIGGTPSVQAFSPFAPTAAYSTSAVGGSGYFDGSGDYLTIPAGSAFAPGTGDFTVDGWIYPTSGAAIQRFYAQSTSGTNYFLCEADVPNKTIRFIGTSSGGGTPIVSAATLQLNAWNHFCISRTSGTVTVWCNGSAGTATSNTTNFSDTSYTPTISGYSHSTGSEPIIGYLSGLRYIKGTALSGATVPTSPPTAVTNTSLLTNYTNAGIYDSAAKNDLETISNAQVSTTTAQWGSTSIKFNGTTDYLRGAISPNTKFPGAFTIETWIYPTQVAARATIFSSPTAASSGTGLYWYVSSSAKLTLDKGGANLATSTLSISANTWTHVAVTRTSAGAITLWINGVSSGTGSDTTNFSDGNLLVGTEYSLTNFWNGYMDDLRITNGLNRYTANFTAPTAAFPIQ